MIWVLFFLSGACALVYEVLWTRQLGLVLGNTVQSLAAVLTAFMSGLALGAWLAGKYAPRIKRHLLAYGLLEISIGVYCAILPLLFQAIVPLYTALYGESGSAILPVARFVLSCLLLLLPATCMGATLPLLSEFLVRTPDRLARVAGGLYAINTFGAVAGAGFTGFLLLPTFGRSETNWLAVGGNLVLGLLAIALSRMKEKPHAKPTDAESDKADKKKEVEAEQAAPVSAPVSPATVRIAALAFGITGFAAMATQIGWTRALSLSIGSSTYAFTLIVTVFILGLALGGAWGARVAPRLKDPVHTLTLVLLMIGLVTMALVALLGQAPLLFFWLMAYSSESFEKLLVAEFFGIGILLIMPTFLMGATMPLTLQVAARREGAERSAGQLVGGLYSINTIGSILGSLIGGLVLLPALGIRNCLVVCALLYTIPGLLLFWKSFARTVVNQRLACGTLAAVPLLAVVILPKWDPLLMNSGAYLMRWGPDVKAVREGRPMDITLTKLSTDEEVWTREGAAATVAVQKNKSGLTLKIGGKPDAGSYLDMSTQVALPLVPELLHSGPPEDVLIVGMGSGVSLGVAVTFPGVKHVDIVEISPDVVLASYFFREFNHLTYETPTHAGQPGWLNTPNIEVIVNDGRNHLLLTSRRYDVIASEPSNPWVAGIGNLFTKEAFELYRARLKPGGILCQWLHEYGMGQKEFKSVLRTYTEVFPHVQLWCCLPGSDYLLLGSDQPLRFRLAEVEKLLQHPGVKPHVAPVSFDHPEEVLACFLDDTEALKHIAKDSPVHTDDNMLLEFAAPRTLYEASTLQAFLWRVSPDSLIDFAGYDKAAQRDFIRKLDRTVMARDIFETYKLQLLEQFPKGPDLLSATLELDPLHFWAKERLPSESQNPRFTPSSLEQEYAAALPGYIADPASQKELLETLNALARLRFGFGRYEQAGADAERALLITPKDTSLLALAARIKLAQRDPAGALVLYKRAVEAGLAEPELTALGAEIDAQGGRALDAVAALEALLKAPGSLNDEQVGALSGQYGELLQSLRRDEAGRQALNRALDLAPASTAVLRSKLLFLERKGLVPDLLEASKLAERLAYLGTDDGNAYIDWAQTELKLAALFKQDGHSEAMQETARRARRAAHTAEVFSPGDPRAGQAIESAWRYLEK